MADENEDQTTQTPEPVEQAVPGPRDKSASETRQQASGGAEKSDAPEKAPGVAADPIDAGKAASDRASDLRSKAANFGARAAGAERDTGPEAASTTSKATNAGSAGLGGKGASAQAAATPGDGKAFELLDKALKDTDWGWKAKTGDDRELGRLTFVNAQNAWVAAAVEDPKRATEAWVKTTRRNPSSEMEQSLADRMKTMGDSGKKQEGPAGGNLEAIAADIGELSKRRDLSENKTRKTALSSSLGEWNIMRGDSQQRAVQAKRARSNELWSPEPDKNQDGLHLLKSFVKGFATHRESVQKKVESKKAKLAAKAIGGIQKELGKVNTSIKKFETELNVPMDERDTIGVVGRSRKAVANNKAFRLGAGTATIVAKVGKKVAEKTAEVAKGVAIQGAVIASAPGAIDGHQGNASYQARMAAFHQFQRSRTGMGPGA